MKGKYLRWICIAALCCIVASVMLGASGSSEESHVKALLEKRTTVMDNVLFGRITYDEGCEQLKQVEADKLYNDDLEALSSYRNTDLESVRSMEIIELKKKSRIYDIMTFYCRIKWTYSSQEGLYENTYEYQVGVDVNGGDFRLISFEIIQQTT